jgi:hypothetical protein
MNAIKINGYIGKDGLKIGIDKLKMFKNRNVEIIIIPKDDDEKSNSKSAFFKAIGKVNIDQEEICSLREVSKI